MTLEEIATDYGVNEQWWNDGKSSKLNIFHGENKLLRFHESIDAKARANGTTVGRELGYLGTYYLTTQGIIYSSVLAATDNHAIAYGAMVAGSKVALVTYPPVRLLIGGISKAYYGTPAPKEQAKTSKKPLAKKKISYEQHD